MLRAVERGDLEVVQLLVDYGANVNASTNADGAWGRQRVVDDRRL